MKQLEAKDLRIGNYVNVIINNEISQISAIIQPERGYYDFEVIDKEGMFWQVDDHIKPIPITEEWLIKFGFEGDDISYKNKGFYNIVRLNSRYNFGFEYQDYSTPLDYVHELQNLYFALTGVELELKQPQNNNT